MFTSPPSILRNPKKDRVIVANLLVNFLFVRKGQREMVELENNNQIKTRKSSTDEDQPSWRSQGRGKHEISQNIALFLNSWRSWGMLLTRCSYVKLRPESLDSTISVGNIEIDHMMSRTNSLKWSFLIIILSLSKSKKTCRANRWLRRLN